MSTPPAGSLAARRLHRAGLVQDDVCSGCGYCVSACAKACPTESIQFGPLDELRERAQQRVSELREAGVPEARLYLEDPGDGIGGAGTLMRTGQVLAASGAAAALPGRRSRALSALAGAALLASSAVTRFGVFEGGRVSARDPEYTVGPQRDRVRERGATVPAAG